MLVSPRFPGSSDVRHPEPPPSKCCPLSCRLHPLWSCEEAGSVRPPPLAQKMFRGDRRSSYRVPVSRVNKGRHDRRTLTFRSFGGLQKSNDLGYQQEPCTEGSDA